MCSCDGSGGSGVGRRLERRRGKSGKQTVNRQEVPRTFSVLVQTLPCDLRRDHVKHIVGVRTPERMFVCASRAGRGNLGR